MEKSVKHYYSLWYLAVSQNAIFHHLLNLNVFFVMNSQYWQWQIYQCWGLQNSSCQCADKVDCFKSYST